MPHMPFLLQNGEKRADGGVGGRIGDLFQDLRGGRAAQLVERIHDLSFPPAEGVIAACGIGNFSRASGTSDHAKFLAYPDLPVNSERVKSPLRYQNATKRSCQILSADWQKSDCNPARHALYWRHGA